MATAHQAIASIAMSKEAAPDVAIRLAKVNKHFGSFQVLRDIDLEVATGERVVVCGPSGSGKSTMIRCVNALEPHSGGEIVVDGVVLRHGDRRSLLKVRRDVGMVFQSFNLFPHLSVLQNCMLAPMHVLGVDSKQAHDRAMHFLERVRIPDQAAKYPGQLSGGQQQRVAIARALVNDPHVILADEPTGNLDSATGEEIMQMLEMLNAAGKTIIMVTHESDIAARAHRTLRMRDGVLESHTPNGALS